MSEVSNKSIGISTDEDKVIFIDALCEKLGYEPTPWRTEFFLEWMRGESTRAFYNPFATTWKVSAEDRGEPYAFNHNGGNPVKNYATLDAGVRATANTMNLNYYKAIMKCVRDQKVTNLPQVCKEFKTWSSVDHYLIANQLRAGWRPTGRNIPNPKAVAKKSIATKSARDAGLLVGGAGITAAVAAIAGADFDPIISAIKQPESFSAILVLAMPLIYRVIRAYIGKGPDAN